MRLDARLLSILFCVADGVLDLTRGQTAELLEEIGGEGKLEAFPL